MQKLTAVDPETKSVDLVAENLGRLRKIFPEAFTERMVDFDVLKQLLGGSVDDGEEKYGLNWHGKRRTRQLALTPSTGTLRPCPEDSVDWDTTQNLMIEGDNLEVLKLLQKSYASKVKLIYIDPPYNTGNDDFIYSDDYHDNIRNYLELTGQVDGNGHKLRSNTEASGRFHTDWLNMMYPRLKLARNLLREDGVIFISNDDHEVDNLRKLCNEVFGEENFIAQFVWNTEGHTDNQFDVKVNHEYITLYAKNSDIVSLEHVVDPNTRQESNLWKGYAENSITKNGPANPPSEVVLPEGFPCVVETLDLSESEILPDFFDRCRTQKYISRDLTNEFAATYPIRLSKMTVRKGKLTTPCSVYSGWANVNKLRAFINAKCEPINENGDLLSFYLSAKGVIYYRRDRTKARNILSVLRNMGTTERMRSELEKHGIPFQYPKPKELIGYLLETGSQEGIVLDFFAGSGTTAQAVLELNDKNAGNRRFILVQLPESTNRTEYSTIAEITKANLRRVSKNLKDLEVDILEPKGTSQRDLGFRVFKLASTNIRAWEPQRENLEQSLEDAIEHLKTDRTAQDILFELILKLGLELTVPIDEQIIAGHSVHSIGAGALIVCLTDQIDPAQVEPLALGLVELHKKLRPASDTMVFFRDSAFADDVAKTNLTAILKQHGLPNVRSL